MPETDDHTAAAGPASTVGRRALMQLIAGGTAALATSGRAVRAADTTLRIGLSAPLTAQFAQNGLWMKNGVTLAVEEINQAGGVGGRPIELFIEDDQGTNPTAAGNAVTKLLTQSRVLALIGPHFTPAVMPIKPLLARAQVPCLTGASGPVVTKDAHPWVFRIRLNDATGAALLVQYVLGELGWKKVGLAYVNTAFGQSGINAVKAALAAKRIEPVLVQTHLDSTKDFTSQILAFDLKHLDGIIAWTDDQPGGLIVKQMTTLGAHFGLAGSTTFSQPLFLQLAGDAAEGIYAVSDFTRENPAPGILVWKAKYRARYGEDPELYATAYYDAIHLLAAALKGVPDPTGPAIQAALRAVRGYQGVMTSYGWTPTGDMVSAGLITRVEHGRPMIAKVLGQA